MLDLITLGVIALAGWVGWRSGLWSTALSLGGLVLGYGAAFLFYRPAGSLLMKLTPLQPVVAYPLGGLVTLVVVAMSISLLRGFIRRRRRRRINDGWHPPLWDGIGGAVLSAGWAFLFLLLVSWVLVWLHGLNPRVPDVSGSVMGRWAQSVVSRLTYVAAARGSGDDTLARAAAAVARDPQRGSESLGGVVSDERAQRLLADPDLRSSLAQGDPKTRNELRVLAGDPRFLQMAHRAGLLRSNPSDLTPEQAEEELAEGMVPLAEAAQRLAADPRVRELLADDDFRHRIESGDLGSLANDPRFNELMEHVLGQLRNTSSTDGE